MHQLIERGLKYGDSCTIVPAGGPRKRLTLNRTAWDIAPAGDAEQGVPLISVPGLAPRSFRWRLELAPAGMGEETRFLLRTLDGKPFALNGQYAREAFLEARDTVCPEGPGRLEFSAQEPRAQFRAPETPAVLSDEAVMRSRLSVLLQGETGTGKGHVAREIHRLSGRSGPFVALNVQAFTASMVEAELFGHRRGAFTGAHADRAGAIAQADGGTLFLDEVDSLSKELQTKLLLFLDDRKFRPVGGQREEQVDARLVFAAGRPLDRLVAKGEMRADFYFRLRQGVVAELPPLRERPENIRRHCQLFSLEKDVVVGERLLQFYQTLPWPGNVRQLRGHLEAKKVRSRTRKLDFDDCDEALVTMTSDLTELGATPAPVRPMDEVKREYARWAYRRCGGEMALAARQLGVNPKTLRVWLEGSVA